MQKGDTVRYLNAVGGGKITRIEGKIAYVEEDGFETPMLVSELVVVLPAGHEQRADGARLMFDQKAVDAVKAREQEARRAAELTKEIKPEPEPELPVLETSHGEKLNLSLAFEPADVKKLSQTSFAAVLVNDSNYFLKLTYLTRAAGNAGWTVAYDGELEPNMVLDLATYTHEQLPQIERVAVQCIAFKKKEFEMKAPVSVCRKLDLKKFYKLHCFRPGRYFDNPVLEIPLVEDDLPQRGLDTQMQTLADTFSTPGAGKKIAADKGNHKKKQQPENPNKLLPLQEIDLHIGELLDSTAGLDNSAMMQVQLSVVRKEMDRHRRRVGQKIVFIHGKGDGVLRNAVRALLKKEYPKAELQDASFKEYGFGATLVTIH